MDDLSDDELLAELGVDTTPIRESTHTPREERIIAGFEDIARFFDEHGRAPQHGEQRDIFERLYAVRLDRLRESEDAKTLLAPLDQHRLLDAAAHQSVDATAPLDDDALIDELTNGNASSNDITKLTHVQTRDERRAAEEIANREPCKDFARFKPLFELAEQELKRGDRHARSFGNDASVAKGDFFILGGVLVYVADMGEPFRAPNGSTDARLRVIYANGTESNLLLRSLQRALYKDAASRRLSESSVGPLFDDQWEADDLPSGTIYVLRSHSQHPFIAQHRELIHKIGVTGGAVATRISNAAHDATYLLAEVEVVATYKLADINRIKMENVFHSIFASAQLDVTINDRFGHPIRPREWFLVPLHVIDEAVNRIRDGSITGVVYDAKKASLINVQTTSST
jgi:T5orf172 domain